VFVLSGRDLCDGPIPHPEESYRLRCVLECDQMQINTLDTYCEQVGRRGKDCETIIIIIIIIIIVVIVVVVFVFVFNSVNVISSTNVKPFMTAISQRKQTIHLENL
jgi:uncharacterized membrane protein YvbJ